MIQVAEGVASILLTNEAALATSIQAHFTGGADVNFDTTGLWLAGAVTALHTHGTIVVISAPAERIVPFPLQDGLEVYHAINNGDSHKTVLVMF